MLMGCCIEELKRFGERDRREEESSGSNKMKVLVVEEGVLLLARKEVRNEEQNQLS